MNKVKIVIERNLIFWVKYKFVIAYLDACKRFVGLIHKDVIRGILAARK